jgi:hypothetical protein
MAATIYVADNWRARAPANPQEHSVLLDDDGYYWHLYRFFEGANLDRREELIDLYGGREIDGYQLDRLEDELNSALQDATRRPEKWHVLTGWHDHPSRQNEILREIDRGTLVELIRKLLWLVAFARETKLKVICSGD